MALLGAGGALVLAEWLVDVLPAVLPPSNFRFEVDLRVVLFTLAVTALAALASGLAPAVRASKPDIVGSIKGEGSGGRGGFAARNALVIGQVALSMTLLTGGALLVRSFINALRADLGFARKSVLVVRTSPRMKEEPARVFYRQLVDRVQAFPRVKHAALACRAPLWPSEGGMSDRISIPGQQPVRVLFNTVEPDYFATLDVPILRGRCFDERDSPGGTRTAVINETMARRFFPDADPVGRLFRTEDGAARLIVGIARDTKVNSLEEAPAPYFYLPFSQDFYGSMSLLVEAEGNPMDLVPAIKGEIASLAKMPAPEIDTIEHLLRMRVSHREVVASLAGLLALVGLLLAASGLYGVMSYLVARRTREIGIRIAIGAGKAETVRLVLGRAVGLAAVGIAIGAAGSLAMASLLSKALYGTTPRDPATLAAVAALLVLVALLASLVPALRAARVDPLSALRTE